jgi:hypothetical protein
MKSVTSFFFEPCAADTLAVIRISTGLMLAYVHSIWLLGSADFFGPNAMLKIDVWNALHRGTVPDWKWSYLALTDSLLVARIHESAALVAGVFVAAGLFTRISLLVAWFLTLITVHRLTGFLFGLDQIVLMLTSYLCLAQSNRVASLDRALVSRCPKFALSTPVRWLTGWFGDNADSRVASWKNQLATRLVQIHLCVIYLFGGLGKLRGEMWWDGSAMWYSAAAYEYQSVDLTWIGNYTVLGALLTHLTLFWEVGYFAIVWPKWTRPVALAMALMVHGGIAIYLGMITFGTMMIIANLAFVQPATTRRICQAFLRWREPASSSTELRNAQGLR